MEQLLIPQLHGTITRMPVPPELHGGMTSPFINPLRVAHDHALLTYEFIQDR